MFLQMNKAVIKKITSQSIQLTQPKMNYNERFNSFKGCHLLVLNGSSIKKKCSYSIRHFCLSVSGLLESKINQVSDKSQTENTDKIFYLQMLHKPYYLKKNLFQTDFTIITCDDQFFFQHSSLLLVSQSTLSCSTCGDEIQGSWNTDEPRQALGSACAWQQTQVDLRKPQSGLKAHKEQQQH